MAKEVGIQTGKWKAWEPSFTLIHVYFLIQNCLLGWFLIHPFSASIWRNTSFCKPCFPVVGIDGVLLTVLRVLVSTWLTMVVILTAFWAFHIHEVRTVAPYQVLLFIHSLLKRDGGFFVRCTFLVIRPRSSDHLLILYSHPIIYIMLYSSYE